MNQSIYFNVRGTTAGKVTVSGKSTYRVEISEVRKGTRFFLESPEDGSPSIVARSAKNEQTAEWTSSVVNLSNIAQISRGQKVETIKLGFIGSMVASFHATTISRQIGEDPSYLMIEATEDNASVIIGSHKQGAVLLLMAEENTALIVRKSGFMIAQEGVVINQVVLTDKNSQVLNELLGSSFLQAISGNGFFCIEVLGDFDTPMTLKAGDSIIVEASRFLAMSESLHIVDVWRVSDKQSVRDVENSDYFLSIKADVRGGYLFLADVSQTRKNKILSSPT